MPQSNVVSSTTSFVPHPKPREGDGSPKISKKIAQERSEAAKERHKKNHKRAQRRTYKKAGERGLQKNIELQQKRREAARRKDGEEASQQQFYIGTPLEPYVKRKVHARKPAGKIPTQKSIKKASRLINPDMLEQKRRNMELREIKRIFKKVLSFAMRQGKKHGLELYFAIVDFICIKVQNLLLQLFQTSTEAT